MKRKFIFLAIVLFFLNSIYGQVITFPNPVQTVGSPDMSEHGFLPGKKFSYYPTIDKYNFSGLKLRVEVFDDRDSLKLKKNQCSEIEFTNTSEFANSNTIFILSKYVDTLLTQSGAIVDSASNDTLQVRFEGIDARLIGFGSIRAHGLCQIKIKYRSLIKTYCIDITDADKHSPLGKNSFATRKTATRIIASASIREVIEKFFVDLKSYLFISRE